MERKNSTAQNQVHSLTLIDHHAVLATGTDMALLYQASLTNKTKRKQMKGFYGHDAARLIAAPIADYENLHLRERLEAICLDHLHPFIKGSGSTTKFIHIHCPDPNSPQAAVLNQSYLELLFKDYFPEYRLYFSFGLYVEGLLEAEKQLEATELDWLSIAIDCLCDAETLQALNKKNQCMTSLNDQPQAPGEAYLFFHFSKKKEAPKSLRIMSTTSDLLKQTIPDALIYPELGSLSSIEQALNDQRQLWPNHPEIKTISPSKVCGDTGAASEALCFILALAAGEQSLILTPYHLAIMIDIQEEINDEE